MLNAKPFVKWAGGKSSLLSQLKANYPLELKYHKINTYVEPFVGGGAVLIDMLQNFTIQKAYAFDINKDLIDTYKTIQSNVTKLIDKLSAIENEYIPLSSEDRKNYYMNIRKIYNQNKKDLATIDKSAYFIFLNRTCYNGLYRVNKSGGFNVPMGNYKKPMICDEENLRCLSRLIKNVTFIYDNYHKSIDYIDNDTFVYFDPPYRPLKESGFTSYAKEDFNDDDQIELANYYKTLSSTGAKLMLSNSNPQNTNPDDLFFKNLYSDFEINEVFASRMISADSSKRGKISELLITNYNAALNVNIKNFEYNTEKRA